MDNSWENFEPSPIEFMHGRLQDEFHKWRKTITENTTVEIDGVEFNRIIAKAKKATYEKYKFMNLDKAIPKSAFDNDVMKVGFIGIQTDELKNVAEIIAKLRQEHGHVIIVGNNQEYAKNIPLRPQLEDIELKPMPLIQSISFIKEKRTNHERLPSRFGKRK